MAALQFVHTPGDGACPGDGRPGNDLYPAVAQDPCLHAQRLTARAVVQMRQQRIQLRPQHRFHLYANRDNTTIEPVTLKRWLIYW